MRARLMMRFLRLQLRRRVCPVLEDGSRAFEERNESSFSLEFSDGEGNSEASLPSRAIIFPPLALLFPFPHFRLAHSFPLQFLPELVFIPFERIIKDLDIQNSDRPKRPICAGLSRYIFERLKDLVAIVIDYTAKNGVFTVKMRCRAICDEELAAVCVWTAVGHAERSAGGMLESSFDIVLVPERLTPDGFAAPTRAVRVAALELRIKIIGMRRSRTMMRTNGERGWDRLP